MLLFIFSVLISNYQKENLYIALFYLIIFFRGPYSFFYVLELLFFRGTCGTVRGSVVKIMIVNHIMYT